MKIHYSSFYFAAILPPLSAWVSNLPNRPFQRKYTVLRSSADNNNNDYSDLQGGVLAEKYVLEEGGTSTSGKSSIFTAYEKDNPEGDPVVIKFSEDNFALYREMVNFDHLDDDLFVDAHEYIEECYFDNQSGVNCEPLENNGALVLEQGAEDLKNYLNTHGALQEPELRSIAWTAVHCLKDMHSKGMVWTDLKAQNLVIVPKDTPHEEAPTVKGIDVESVIPHKGSVIDYTPRGSPPEFAIHFLCGSEKQMEISYNFDIWSLGILLHEMATGQHYFEEGEHIEIATELRNTKGLDVDDVPDLQLRDLVKWCLELDPSHRPTIEQVVDHPYFMQTQGDTSSPGASRDNSQNIPHSGYSQDAPANLDWSLASRHSAQSEYTQANHEMGYSQNAPTMNAAWGMASHNSPHPDYTQNSPGTAYPQNEPTSVDWSMAPQDSAHPDNTQDKSQARFSRDSPTNADWSSSAHSAAPVNYSPQTGNSQNTPTNVEWSMAPPPQNTPGTDYAPSNPETSRSQDAPTLVNWSMAPQNIPTSANDAQIPPAQTHSSQVSSNTNTDGCDMGQQNDPRAAHSSYYHSQTAHTTSSNVDWSLAPQNTPESTDPSAARDSPESDNAQQEIKVNWSLGS